MNNQNERYSKLRRQKINVMLNEEERRIITEKLSSMDMEIV